MKLCILVYETIKKAEEGQLLIFLLIPGRKLEFIAASDESAYVTLSTSEIFTKNTLPLPYDAKMEAVKWTAEELSI